MALLPNFLFLGKVGSVNQYVAVGGFERGLDKLIEDKAVNGYFPWWLFSSF